MEGTSVFTTAITNWTTLINGVVSIIEANPLMVTMFSIPLIGGAVGLLKRLV